MLGEAGLRTVKDLAALLYRRAGDAVREDAPRLTTGVGIDVGKSTLGCRCSLFGAEACHEPAPCETPAECRHGAAVVAMA